MDSKVLPDLTVREWRLLKFIRQLGWGEVRVRVENGQPVVVYEAVRTCKLQDPGQKSRAKQ